MNYTSDEILDNSSIKCTITAANNIIRAHGLRPEDFWISSEELIKFYTDSVVIERKIPMQLVLVWLGY